MEMEVVNLILKIYEIFDQIFHFHICSCLNLYLQLLKSIRNICTNNNTNLFLF